MLYHLLPTDSITAVMSWAANTTNPTYAAQWDDGPLHDEAGSLSGATAVTLIPAPASGSRGVRYVQIYNADDATVTVTVSHVRSGTSRTIATFTGAASIKSGAGTHVMIGHALMGNDTDNTVVLWQATAANTFDTIDLLGTANSTGGIAGQRIVITGLSTTRWHVEITGDAAGTEATPFQDTVA